jgi:hypothetical protein
MNHFHSILRNFKNAILIVVFCFISNSIIHAQITISSSGTSYSESFNGMGTASNASLPTNWKAQSSASTTQWTGMSFTSGSSAVAVAGGNSMSGTASGSIYRFNANNSTSESALGGLSSGSAAKTVVFMAEFINSGALAISSLNIAYNVEKYRNGSNASGFSIGLFYSTNGTSWISCGSGFITSFPADANNNGFATAPGSSVAVSSAYTPTTSVGAGGSFFLAWRYSVTSGTTTSNAQALGFDDVVVTAQASACTPPADPFGSITMNPGCDSTELIWPGSTTNHYWQTSPTGNSTTLPASASYWVKIPNSTIHIRQLDPATSCWSSGTVSQLVSSVSATSSISVQPTNKIVGAGNNTTFSVTASNSPLYQWQENTGSGWTSLTNSPPYSNVNTNILTITGLTLAMNNNQYRCEVSSASPCVTVVNSSPASLTVTLPAWEDFETGSKTGYTIGNVTCKAGSWSMNDALTGTSASDPKNGSTSCRIRNGDLTMNFDVTNGLDSIVLFHAKYVGDANSDWQLQVSNNGGTSWTAYVSPTITSSSTTLTRQAFYVKLTGTLRFRICKTAGGTTRFNIDDIYVSDFVCNTPSTSSGSATGLSEQCTDAQGWTYYGNSSGNYFAINKNGNTFTATVDVTIGNASSKINTSVTNKEHGSYLMDRAWNATLTSGSIVNPVTIRFFYDQSDSTITAGNRNTAFAGLSGTTSVITPFQWFKTVGTPYNSAWIAAIDGNMFPTTHVKLTNATVGTFGSSQYVDLGGITSFSGGTGGAGFGPTSGSIGLPVTWAGFEVKAAESGNKLDWSTASEQNTSHFEIEYSYDGVHFQNQSTQIPAAGWSQTEKKYSFVHSDFSAQIYYRIKQIDIDGRFSYSIVRIVKRTTFSPSFVAAVYPNLIHSEKEVTINVFSIDKSPFYIRLYDLNGHVLSQIVAQAKKDSILEKMDVANLSPGIYIIELQNGQGREFVKIMK